MTTLLHTRATDDGRRASGSRRRIAAHRMDIVQLIYRPHAPQGACKDYEFSRVT
jgi:hypothetical protein